MLSTSTSPDAADRTTWPPPDLDHPESLAGNLFSILIPLAVLMTGTLAARCYSRLLLRSVWGWSDWTMLAAWVLTAAQTVLILYCTTLGFGRHLWDVKDEWFTTVRRINKSWEVFFAVSVSLTKVSVCTTYLNLFPFQPRNRAFCIVAISYCALWGLAVVTIQLEQFVACSHGPAVAGVRPPHAAAAGPPPGCVDVQLFLLCAGALNNLSDAAVFLWPAQFIMGMRVSLSRKQRLGLMGLFCTGCMVCIAGAIRMYYLHIWFKTQDIYWTGVPNYYLAALETNLGVVFGCLPCCRPLLAHVLPNLFEMADTEPPSLTPIEGSGLGYGPGTNCQGWHSGTGAAGDEEAMAVAEEGRRGPRAVEELAKPEQEGGGDGGGSIT